MKISFVIPTINSSKIIEKNVELLDNFISKIKEIDDYEIVVAAQTSKDNTFQILNKLKSKRIISIFVKQIGKGAGLNAGIKKAKFDWILMTDDDLPYPLEFVKEVIQNIKDYDLIIGSRYLNRSEHITPFLRKTLSYLYRKLVNIMFNIPQKDTQAGIKMIKKEIFKKIPYPREKGWVWDTELLYFANKKKFKILEKATLPTQTSNQLRITKDVPKMLWRLLCLRTRTILRK